MVSTEHQPAVAVIMLNWNTPEMTIQAIQSVLDSDYPNLKVHITDNGSADDSFDRIRQAFDQRVEVHRIEKNRGYVGGMNYCLGKGKGDHPYYFLIMNNDIIIDKEAITHLVNTSEKYGDRCVVTGKVYYFDPPDVLQSIGNRIDRKTMQETRLGYNEKDTGQYDEEAEREMIDDIFMLMPVKVYEDVGGYSTLFYLNYEQTDLLLRIINKGYKAIYTPHAKLWHKGSFSTGGLGNPYMMYWEGKSSIIIHDLYQTNKDFIIFYEQYLRKLLWSLLKQLIKALIGREHKLNASFARLRGFMAGTAWLFHRREETGYNPYS